MMRRMSLFPRRGTALGNLGLTEEEIRDEVENDTYELVSEFVKLPTRARIQAIRALPMSFYEKRNIRSRVISVKLSKKHILPTCCTDCNQQVSLFFRRFGAGLATARQRLVIWQDTLKEIGGRFGTSVVSYFHFLKWLLMFNVFSLLINFCFITIPQIVHLPNITHPISFRGLELLTGVGYFNQTVFFYGGYDGSAIETQPFYNMQLAYFFTIAAYLVLCGISLIYSMARSFRSNFVLMSDPTYGGAWRLLCSWDFSVVNEKAIQNHKNNLGVQLKESLSERLQRKAVVSVSVRLQQLSLQLLAWLLSLGLALGSCAAIYFLQLNQIQLVSIVSGFENVVAEASTLLVPVVVSLINLVVPLLYSLINKMEQYTNPRTNVYVIILRNVLLKMSILGILCYYWLNEVPITISCWESFVGQSVYRLVVVDFIFCLFGSFFGEFLRNVIGTKCIQSLGVPEFDIATNVLNLIYAQTLAWIGIYFAPLLPVIQVIKFFIIFYLKRASLSMNCQPPKRTGRAAQMQTVYIALLFFPSFVGALSMVAYTVWSLKPSELCGPFQGLGTPFQAIHSWMGTVHNIPGSQWAWWIFEHVLKNELFFYLITLIVLIFTYFVWQVTQGRKQLIQILREQIVNEGKDKAFLLNKLQGVQKQSKAAMTFSPQGRRGSAAYLGAGQEYPLDRAPVHHRELTETTFFNQNWMNTFPLDM
ncbi:transmembrane channel-like protein 5 isoform X2 [Salminus brasiliensis]|uniref:transmembrane channel-like protein 5 isoform X2 n=1 Tax=Salminus brasiliensis TaxID=930266 RepID=UPI003B837FA2